MNPVDKKIAEAIRDYVAQEDERIMRHTELRPNFTATVMARIDEIEARKSRHKSSNMPARPIMERPDQRIDSVAPKFWWIGTRTVGFSVAAALIVVGLVFFFIFQPQPMTLAMAIPPHKGGTPPLNSPWVNDNVAVTVNWKDSSLNLSLKDGGALTGKLSPSEGSPGAPALPYQFDLSMRGRSGTGAEIIGSGQLLVMPKDSTTTRGKLKPATILWAKLNLKLQAGGQEDPVYRVFGTP